MESIVDDTMNTNVGEQCGWISLRVEFDRSDDVLNEVVKLRAINEEQKKSIELLQKNSKNMDIVYKWYTSKGWQIILSPPFDIRRVSNFTHKTLRFFVGRFFWGKTVGIR